MWCVCLSQLILLLISQTAEKFQLNLEIYEKVSAYSTNFWVWTMDINVVLLDPLWMSSYMY